MPSSERIAFFVTGCCAFLLGAAVWKDPARHVVRFVEVEPGVKVEVLDWGGSNLVQASGEAVLLLAGHGDTGHIFDDFAPALGKGFRVLALTRRGFGASSQPADGYNPATLAKDIAQVMAALKLDRVTLVGHSIAGDEMTRFAVTYPAKVAKLVYLEAAYDRVETQRVETTFPKLRPLPGPTPSDLESPSNLRAYVARTEILMPEAEIRATRVFGPDRRFQRDVTPEPILSALARAVEHPMYDQMNESIHAPILAIYAVPEIPDQMLPRYKFSDAETRAAIDKIFEIWTAAAKQQRDSFRKRVPQARVVELNGASHYVFISHREQVLQEVRAFLKMP